MRRLELRKKNHFPFLLFLLLTLMSLFIFSYISASPVFIHLAEAGCDNYARSALYDATLSLSENENFSDLTEITRDNGHITAVSLNSEKANRIRSLLASEVNALFSEESNATFTIPLGNITEIPLLSGRGPKIPVKIVSLGGMDADIISDFSDAGINQTRHSVYIKARIKLRLMSPFNSAVTETVTTVPLSETIIVGELPLLYASGEK